MFVSAAFAVFSFAAVGTVLSDTYKKVGGVAVLSPDFVSPPITSVTWKHGADIAVERYGQETIAYRDFNGRCEVDPNTGALKISNLTLKDSGTYTPEINSRIMSVIKITVINAVPKPTITKQCNLEETRCTLTCEANITKDTGTVTYSWEIGDKQRPNSTNQLVITKDDAEFVGKPIRCQLTNPVSSKHSDITSPFTNGSSGGLNPGMIVLIVLVMLVPVVLTVLACWGKRKPENKNKSWRQYLGEFPPLKCLNPDRSTVPQDNTNGAIKGVSYSEVQKQEQPTMNAAGPENQNNPEQPVTNNEAERSAEAPDDDKTLKHPEQKD